MSSRSVRARVAGLAVLAVGTVGTAAAPAPAASQLAVSRLASSTVAARPVSSGPGISAGQVLASTRLPDTCADLRRRPPSRAGGRWQACITPASSAPASVVRPALAGLPSWCVAGSWSGNRTDICSGGAPGQLVVTDSSQGGKVVGRALFTVVQYIQLHPLARSFVENVEVKVTSVAGQLRGASVNLAVKCGGTCTATSHFRNGRPIVAGLDETGLIAYSDSTTDVNTTASTYTLSWGLATTKPGAWTSPSYRCDDRFKPRQGAGCVVPRAIPTMTSMTQLPHIAANIRRIQDAGPHHYGRPGGSYPLTRNSGLESANRKIACPDSRTRPSGQSCDEYPFATTDKGASRTQQPDWGWAWVPIPEQSRQGGLVDGFYRQQRVLDGVSGAGDKYWVQV